MATEYIRISKSDYENLKGRIATLEANLYFLAEISLPVDKHQAFLKNCGPLSNILEMDRDKVRQMLPDPPPGGDGAPEH